MDMEQQILVLLRGMNAGDRPLTFGYVARQFGVSYDSVARCAQLMVDTGVAKSVSHVASFLKQVIAAARERNAANRWAWRS